MNNKTQYIIFGVAALLLVIAGAFILIMSIRNLRSSSSGFNVETAVAQELPRRLETIVAQQLTERVVNSPATQPPAQPPAQSSPQAATSPTPMTVETTNFTWNIEYPDAESGVGRQSSLAIDQNNRPHIAHYYEDGAKLLYTHLADDGWKTIVIDQSNGNGLHPSLKLDSTGKPQIAHYVMDTHVMMYLRWTGSFWQQAAWLTNIQVGNISMALDITDNPHIAVYDSVNSVLDYVAFKQGILASSPIASVGVDGTYFPLALKITGEPCVAYFDPTTGLKFAELKNGNWETVVVDPGQNVGYNPNLTIDPWNNPHLSYFDQNQGLKHAYFKDGAWKVEVVDPGNVGKYSSIVVDKKARIHISYYDEGNKSLKYAIWDTSQWKTSTIDSNNVGRETSLALDQNGLPHIAYYSKAEKTLKYASASVAP